MTDERPNVTHPALGLNGDYSGTCLFCRLPTDTGLVFSFESDTEHALWLAKGTGANAFSMADAQELAATQPRVRGTDNTVYYQICEKCTAGMCLPRPTVVHGGTTIAHVAIKRRD